MLLFQWHEAESPVNNQYFFWKPYLIDMPFVSYNYDLLYHNYLIRISYILENNLQYSKGYLSLQFEKTKELWHSLI